MILIADSGSTKTAWASASGGLFCTTPGLNPHFATDADVFEACRVVKADTAESVEKVFFYGAGCGDETQRKRMHSLLCRAFEGAEVEVQTDLLGACRALWGTDSGAVGILGTGSNACLFDGHRIVASAFSTGFILGDHGSANHVGRMLLQDYLSSLMPSSLSQLFHAAFPLEKWEFIDAVYHRPAPNRFLASLAPFAVQHSVHPYCQRLLTDALEAWLRFQLLSLPSLREGQEVRLVGSFAAALDPLLAERLSAHGLTLGPLMVDPLPSLCAFHSSR